MNNKIGTSSYVLILVFCPEFENVLLIERTKDDWQKGMLNGLGGKIDKNEKPFDAVLRELKEEYYYEDSKDLIVISNFGVMQERGMFGNIYAYACIDKNYHNNYTKFCEQLYEGRIEVEGKVRSYDIKTILTDVAYKKKVLSNITWMIPMAIDYISINKRSNDYNFITSTFSKVD